MRPPTPWTMSARNPAPGGTLHSLRASPSHNHFDQLTNLHRERFDVRLNFVHKVGGSHSVGDSMIEAQRSRYRGLKLERVTVRDRVLE